MARSIDTIKEEVASIYIQLSPENLTCDGELPTADWQKKEKDLRSKLKTLFKEAGRTISEEEAFREEAPRVLPDKEEFVFQSRMEDEILTLIDNQDDYTRSDLQGRVMAIVMQTIAWGKKRGNKP